MFKRIKEFFAIEQTLKEKKQALIDLEAKTKHLEDLRNQTIQKALDDIKADADNIIYTAKTQANTIVDEANKEVLSVISKKVDLDKELEKLSIEVEKAQKENSKYEKINKKHKVETLGIQTLIEKFPQAIKIDIIENELKLLGSALELDGAMDPIVNLDFHHKNSKSLKSEMNTNNKEIKSLLASYQTRYTTKANLTIYELMVIGLQAELQNILYTLSYTNLDKALDNCKALIQKYLIICGNGNASILPTITRFLSELEPLYYNAIRIEYKYFIQKELEKEEQRRIREQMRQEAEERRQLEEERKKIEKEEEKYQIEIQKNLDLLKSETDITKISAIQNKLNELHEQFNKLEEQKEEITKRANGKAGHVYVISNLGSFGDRVYKIGMTRRLNPLDRIEELGDASVPFTFDIHALIFSDNAVDLEQKLHKILDGQRVNKVNLRKEFFYSDVEALQQLVQDVDPTAEFVTTMKASEYRQSEALRLEEMHEQRELTA